MVLLCTLFVYAAYAIAPQLRGRARVRDYKHSLNWIPELGSGTGFQNWVLELDSGTEGGFRTRFCNLVLEMGVAFLSNTIICLSVTGPV